MGWRRSSSSVTRAELPPESFSRTPFIRFWAKLRRLEGGGALANAPKLALALALALTLALAPLSPEAPEASWSSAPSPKLAFAR